MNYKGFRIENLFCLGICVLVLFVALYMQYYMGIDPCILCITQRFVFVCAAFLFFLAVLHNPFFGGHRIYGMATLFFSFIGASVAARQLYLQYFSFQKFSDCSPGFDYILNTFPLNDIAVAMLTGAGSCSDIQWEFFSISTPGWSLITFTLLVFLSLYLGFSRPKTIFV